MACETGKWESILPNNATEIDDGSVFIDELDGSGNITKGRYRPKDANPGQDEDNCDHSKDILGVTVADAPTHFGVREGSDTSCEKQGNNSIHISSIA